MCTPQSFTDREHWEGDGRPPSANVCVVVPCGGALVSVFVPLNADCWETLAQRFGTFYDVVVSVALSLLPPYTLGTVHQLFMCRPGGCPPTILVESSRRLRTPFTIDDDSFRIRRRTRSGGNFCASRAGDGGTRFARVKTGKEAVADKERDGKRPPHIDWFVLTFGDG